MRKLRNNSFVGILNKKYPFDSLWYHGFIVELWTFLLWLLVLDMFHEKSRVAQHIKSHFWWCSVMRCRVHSVGDFDPTAAPSSWYYIRIFVCCSLAKIVLVQFWAGDMAVAGVESHLLKSDSKSCVSQQRRGALDFSFRCTPFWLRFP